MSRLTLLVDRVVVLLVGLALLAGGLAAGWWWSDRSGWGPSLETDSVVSLVGQSWWPWASAAAGVVLVLLGLRWLVAHLPRRSVPRLHLHGSGRGGRLDVVAGKVAGAAADAYADTVGVRSARGVVRRDRGQLVARLSAVIEPEADLRLLAERADTVSAELAHVLGREDVRCSVQLRVARTSRSLPRVG